MAGAAKMGGNQKRPNDTPARRKYKLMGMREKNKAKRMRKQAAFAAKQKKRAAAREGKKDGRS